MGPRFSDVGDPAAGNSHHPIFMVRSSCTCGSRPICAVLLSVFFRASPWAERGEHRQTWLKWFLICQFWWPGASNRAIYSPLNWTSTSRTKLCFKQRLLLQQCSTHKNTLILVGFLFFAWWDQNTWYSRVKCPSYSVCKCKYWEQMFSKFNKY